MGQSDWNIIKTLQTLQTLRTNNAVNMEVEHDTEPTSLTIASLTIFTE